MPPRKKKLRTSPGGRVLGQSQVTRAKLVKMTNAFLKYYSKKLGQ